MEGRLRCTGVLPASRSIRHRRRVAARPLTRYWEWLTAPAALVAQLRPRSRRRPVTARAITCGQSADDPAGVLAALSAVRELRRWLVDTEQALVQAARRRGLSWVQLGAAWGLSRQGAFNRWARHVTPTAAPSAPAAALSAPLPPPR